MEEAGDVIGAAVCLFTLLALGVTAVMLAAAPALCTVLQAPAEAFSSAVAYVRICSGGAVFIVAYNVLGSVFRGMGDSRTPLLTVLIACLCNIGGDLLFVAGFGMGTAGAAIATVLAQALSVLLCLLIVRRRGLPFPFGRQNIRLHPALAKKTLALGFPIALQDLLVSISFLVILAIVNSLGLIASAGVGVAEKLCAFIMLVPSAFSQALSAFVGQNIGAGQYARARKAMVYGMLSSFAIGCVLAYLSFFHGSLLAGLFAKDAEVIAAAADYLRAYSFDTMLTSFLFCFIGYFNGCGKTRFNMIQGILGAFCVRIPVSWAMSHVTPVSLFRIGMATPCSTVVQICLCSLYFSLLRRRAKAAGQEF
jgi:putative MATE family efflux protein